MNKSFKKHGEDLWGQATGSRKMAAMGLMSMYAALLWQDPHMALEGMAGCYERKPKPLTKCGLPGCEVMSDRDYCCAEHCREHRKKKLLSD